ncbi:asparagine synthase (glutamine-hydrolysing) [Sphingomonas naasensis]|nr:asparagine synthase (glutamine-hydrolysing) [Sphingomonas naasensis]
MGELPWMLVGRDALIHRGPDDAGTYTSDDRRVMFAHRRLAIVDLSPLGHQPMAIADNSLWLTYNGEIYNHIELRAELEALGHRFRSTSDTEVVLAAYRQWGRDFLTRLDGMFALALHDVRENRMILARDRAGEKPLFYRLRDGELRFASELKGLFADRDFERVVDPAALDCYLGLGYVPGNRCLIAGVSKLPAAHALEFNCANGTARTWRYWDLPAYAGGASPDSQALVEELEALLTGAVRRQLVADVPVGLLLSGGVDSSLITALAVRAGGRLKTYTVGFPEYADVDETAHAAFVANHFATDHTVLAVDMPQPDILTKMAYQYDEPIIDSSMIPTYLVSEQIARHCKVAIGGDGGDELFGGYYSASRVARLEQVSRYTPLWPRRLLASAATHLLPTGVRMRSALRMLGTDLTGDLPPISIQLDEKARSGLIERKPPISAEAVRAGRVPAETDAVQRMTRYDFANYMAEDILVKVDRASMLNSLEIRAPFLDREVIEFAYGRVPSSLKATPKARKIILRQLAKRVLPAGFDAVRKQGFTIPLDRWLRAGPWRAHVEQVLYDPDSAFSRSEVASLFAGLDKGRQVREQLFGLTLFEEWRRQHGVELPLHS